VPLALSLQHAIGVLRTAAAALGPWSEIVPLEATVIERARSRFLVDWFGPRLPFDGLSLRVYVMNVDDLARQYLLAQRSVPTSPGGPNLTTPLLGFTGMLAGILLTPIGAIAGVMVMFRFVDVSFKTVVAAIAWIALPGLLIFGLIARPAGTAVLFAGLVAAAAGGQALAMGLGDRRLVRGAYNVFGALARLMNASLVLLGQMLGPRSEVRNPLLARLLSYYDQLAALLAQVIGAVAVVVTRIGPVLAPVAATLTGLGRLVGAVGNALGEIVAGLMGRLDQVRTGDLAIAPLAARVAAVAQRQVERIVEQVAAHMTTVVTVLGMLGSELGRLYGDFMAKLQDFFPRLLRRHAVVQVIQAFRKQITIFSTAWAATPNPPPTPGPSAIAPLIAALPKLPPVPAFPELPPAPDPAKVNAALDIVSRPPLTFTAIEQIAAQLGRERTAHLELGKEASTAVERELKRPGIFTPERSALEAGLGRTPFEALALNRQQLEQFRQALAVVVGRVLPPEMRAVYAPKLAEILTAIDRRLYGVEGPAPAELPVLDLPTSERLRVVVPRLRVRAPGAELADARRFGELLLERVRGRTYQVAAAGAP
jgi:hypothetical protein